MINPTYEGDFEDRPELFIAAPSHKNGPVFSVGIKTITHNRSGLAVVPHKVVVVEMSDSSELCSFDLDPRSARYIAQRMLEFADKVEIERGSFHEIKKEIMNVQF